MQHARRPTWAARKQPPGKNTTVRRLQKATPTTSGTYDTSAFQSCDTTPPYRSSTNRAWPDAPEAVLFDAARAHVVLSLTGCPPGMSAPCAAQARGKRKAEGTRANPSHSSRLKICQSEAGIYISSRTRYSCTTTTTSLFNNNNRVGESPGDVMRWHAFGHARSDVRQNQ